LTAGEIGVAVAAASTQTLQTRRPRASRPANAMEQTRAAGVYQK
jgi:hypothetical protein